MQSQTLPDLSRISDYVAYYARETPNADAMALSDRVWTYSQLWDEINRVSRALIGAGVKKGDRVATLSPPHPDYFITFLAASSIGAIWLGLNPRYQMEEHLYALSDSEPVIVFARTSIGGRDYREDLKSLREQVSSIKTVIVLSDDEVFDGAISYSNFTAQALNTTIDTLLQAREAVSPSDTALIVYTSGSTGRPKGAMLPHKGLVTCSRVQHDYWHCSPLRVLNYAPINHVGCVGDISSFCLVAGGRMTFMEQFNPALALEYIKQDKITWFLAVPTVLQMMLAVPDIEERDLSSLQVIGWSGAPAPRSLVEDLVDRFEFVGSSYGSTETVGSVTFASSKDGLNILAETIGFAVPGYEVRVAREDWTEADVEEEGEILVRGDFIMNGYWNREDATRETINRDGWLHTGDIGVRSSDGTLRVVGRIKEMFISGGYNVFPREVETAIEANELVDTVAVVPMPDELYGEVGCAFVLSSVADQLSSDELLAYCRSKLANYKIPKRFVIRDELPMLPIGKIDKNALKHSLAQQDG